MKKSSLLISTFLAAYAVDAQANEQEVVPQCVAVKDRVSIPTGLNNLVVCDLNYDGSADLAVRILGYENHNGTPFYQVFQVFYRAADGRVMVTSPSSAIPVRFLEPSHFLKDNDLAVLTTGGIDVRDINTADLGHEPLNRRYWDFFRPLFVKQ
ncbi:TPA: hypothetical protein HA241_06395 [Candidatus Woesearchaeota archaeon]|nr:hypothetical protein [Candidatus Woesearchaeota archaeon]